MCIRDSCGSGVIDVESGPTKITLTRPFQATLVETAGQPPTPPITVNLFNTPIGNNLQISPPRIIGGGNIVVAARAAAAATGVTKENKKEDKGSENDSDAEQQTSGDKKSLAARRTANRKSTGQPQNSMKESADSESDQEDKTSTTAEAPSVKTDLAAAVVENSAISVAQAAPAAEEPPSTTSTTTTAEKENPYVKKLWKDKSETKQVGWQYESLAPNNRNYANITLPVDTKVQVIVTQDMQTNSWNFSSTKAQGQIVINQQFR